MDHFEEAYDEARRAGEMAAEACTPTPMVVGKAKSLLSNEIDETTPVEIVEGGVCGFAWAIVRPGNSKFANWLKKNDFGRYDPYHRGVIVSPSGNARYTQSLQRKEAYIMAFIKTLNNNGITNVSLYSRMD